MKAVYIGILTAGTTSRMRAERLRVVTPGWEWSWIDTDGPMRAGARVWRSLAFRWKRGPVVAAINREVRRQLSGEGHGLAWVDKGVFLDATTMGCLRARAKRLVHFTPDTAFFQNRSRWFEAAIRDYDLLVTTKSFEVGHYEAQGAGERLLLTTQGYDGTLHRPPAPAVERRRELAFVGLAEADREQCVGALLDAGLAVRVGGRGWGRFRERYGSCPHFHFEGEAVFGADYARLLGGSWIGLGLLSKRFPELHTTRTFEIPACGAILATERTVETGDFFGADEALFFEGHANLVDLARELLQRPAGELAALAEIGRNRVLQDGRDYDSILTKILSDPRAQP